MSYVDNLDHCFSVIGLSETWLNPSNVSAYSIPGYNHVAQTRCAGKGGGISLFVAEKCVYSEMTDYCMVNDYIESLFVKITNNGMVFAIGLIYRPQTPILFNLLKLWTIFLEKYLTCLAILWVTTILIF